MVRWLHISDLHIAEHADWNNFKIELLQKCQNYDKIDLVIVTGDFHNFSECNDFHLAVNFLRDLVGSLGLDIEQDLFVVPGNHDGVSDVQEKNIRIKAAKYDPFAGMTKWVEDLLPAFQEYEVFVNEVIPNYPKEHPAEIHSRVWRDKINFIHCNTALGADGEEKNNQLIDVNTLAITAFRSDMPNIILAHNSFFDLHEKLQSRVKDAIRAHSVCAYFCGDRHAGNVDHIPLSEGIVPCIVSYKGAPDPKDSYSTFGIIFGEWIGKQASLTGWRWKSGQGFCEDDKITGHSFPLWTESDPLPTVLLNVQEPADKEPSQSMGDSREHLGPQVKEYTLKSRLISRYYQLSHQQYSIFNQRHTDMQLLKEMSPAELYTYVETAQEKGILEDLVRELNSL